MFKGVTVMVAVAVVVPLLIAIKGAIFPEPLPGRPIAELSFVQVYAVALIPVKVTGIVLVLLHNIWFAEGSTKTVGKGRTYKNAALEKLPAQPLLINLVLNRYPFCDNDGVNV
jgi:hypothetical protein